MTACILDREGGIADDPSGGTGAGGGTGTGVDVGGSGTGTGTGTTTGTSTGTPGPEDCQDGIDNDDNMLVDCADPSCQPGYVCVPEPPSGWSVPSYVASNGFPGPALDCPGGVNPHRYYRGPGDPASCSECACNDSGLDCTMPTVGCWQNDSSCNNQPDWSYTPSVQLGCTNALACTGSCSNDYHCQQIANSVVTGQCPASGGVPTVGAKWKEQTTVCASPTQGGGCQANEICIPAPPPDFGAEACVVHEGDQPCPAGYESPAAMFLDGTDTRGCAPCGCDEGAVSCTSGTTLFRDGNSCSGTSIGLASCTDVTDLMDNSQASIQGTPGSLSGSCAPTGGQPTGAVTPTGPATLCCP